MDASDRSSPRSRQLQGPRPPRLAVSKDSHKVKKPPVAPQPRGGGAAQPGRGDHHHPPRQPQQQQQHRAPVIIYDASPKVIHTRPSEFMALVQRLTGPGAPPAEQPLQQQQPVQFQPQEFMLSPTAALSPAARYAAIERSVRPLPLPPSQHAPYGGAASFLPGGPGPGADLFDGFAEALGVGPSRSGILSPMPSALPPAASSGLFSPLPFDPSAHSWLNDLSPFLPSAGARDAPFAPSPRTSMLLSTPTMPSPATVSVLEFFSYFPDL